MLLTCSYGRTLWQSGTSGALTIDAICQEGAFVADNIAYYADAKLATELTSEADWKRRGLYPGPQVCDVLMQGGDTADTLPVRYS